MTTISTYDEILQSFGITSSMFRQKFHICGAPHKAVKYDHDTEMIIIRNDFGLMYPIAPERFRNYINYENSNGL